MGIGLKAVLRYILGGGKRPGGPGVTYLAIRRGSCDRPKSIPLVLREAEYMCTKVPKVQYRVQHP